MRRAGLAAVLPLPCLLLLALGGRAWNLRQELAVPRLEVTPVLSATNDQGAVPPRKELKALLLRYRTLRGVEQQRATSSSAWRRWQNTLEGEAVHSRLAQLRTWPDFSVQAVEQRDSGFITVTVACDGEYLKAWLVQDTGGWKLAGLVRPIY